MRNKIYNTLNSLTSGSPAKFWTHFYDLEENLQPRNLKGGKCKNFQKGNYGHA